jgi:hypothetical protein
MKQKNEFIKAANEQTHFSNKKELEDFIKCSDPKTGYQYFLSNFFMIQSTVHGAMLYKPYPYQVELARNFHDYRYSINMLGRQMGKSTTAAGYLLWRAMFVKDSTILIAAHKYSGAQEIMSRIRFAYENCPMHIKAGIKTYNKGTLEFDNDSRIIAQATTENTGRGLSISLLYCLDGDTSYVTVRNKETLKEETITLAELYGRLTGAERIIT